MVARCHKSEYFGQKAFLFSMDPLSVIGSCVGIVSLGLQLSDKISKHIDNTKEAPERLTQLVVELKATAQGIKDLDELLERDRDLEQPLINKAGRLDYYGVIRQCDVVFRKVATLVAKAGRSALVTIDEFKHRVNDNTGRGETSPEAMELDIELSSIEKLTWPWKLPKIEQCVRDLEHLRQSLGFRLTVATLGAIVRSRATNTEVDDSHKDQLSAKNLKDQLFYQHQELEEQPDPGKNKKLRDQPNKNSLNAEKQNVSSTQIFEDVKGQFPETTQETEEAERVLDNWPFWLDEQVISLAELQELKITLQAVSIPPSGANFTLESCFSQRELLELAMSQARGRITKKGMWFRLYNMPLGHEKLVHSFTNASENLCMRIIYLKIRHRYMRRAYESFRLMCGSRSSFGDTADFNTIFLILAFGTSGKKVYFDRENFLWTTENLSYAQLGQSLPGPCLHQPLHSPPRARFAQKRQSAVNRGGSEEVSTGEHSPLSSRFGTPSSAYSSSWLTIDFSVPTEEEKNSIAYRVLKKWTTLDKGVLQEFLPEASS